MVTDRDFLGQETDTAVGLSYLNNRYYDPAIGMFLSVDPLVATTGFAYLYGDGNPVTLSDPSGLCATADCYEAEAANAAPAEPFGSGIDCASEGSCTTWGGLQPKISQYEFDARPGYGTVYFAFFIADERAGVPFISALQSHGDDRGFSRTAPVEASRAWGLVDFEQGHAVIGVNPSCGTGGYPGDCHAALNLSGNASTVSNWLEFAPFVEDTNKVTFSESGGRISIGLHVKNSDKKTFAPRIDAKITMDAVASIRIEGADRPVLGVSWHRDPFPMMEIYRITPQGRVSTIAQESSWGIAAASLTPFAGNNNGSVADHAG